ncbi:MAG: glycine--tRNA ligase subunit beta [Desulfovibrionaceae bacterium]|nr:glycine--tRNA ligase subunit beta [Desulfovibrionaceae bacterium]
MSHCVLELGTEELPARFLASLERELKESFAAALAEADLAFDSLDTASTPRRAVIHVRGLAERQPLREEVALGPSLKAAYGPDGAPTRAALGFARGQGVNVADLFTRDTEKGVYVAARRTVGGASAMSVLEELIPRVIASLSFPKRMRWADGDFAFARPLRWILALLDADIVPFRVGNVESGRQTRGHRVHGPGPFDVAHADQLDEMLKATGRITPAGVERRAAIVRGGDGQAARAGGRVLWNDALLDEVQGLTEHPVPLLGDFDPSYLELPREVLLTSMEQHQKSFGVEDAEGRLMPHFLTVLNLDPQDLSVVKKGWERVLRARLEDARFYWNSDLKAGFDTWIDGLEHVIFLGPLGSMGDKCRRLRDLCAWLADRPGVNLDPALAAEAGRLSKADLVSQMVGEFDTLQGVMGAVYARHMGIDPAVADALADQYLPAGPDSPLPATRLGALLSLADKADTLTGCFGLGNIPTGAADPYALRRCALGMARILMETGWRVPVDDIFRKAWSLYREDLAWKLPAEEALGKLDDFFAARLRNLFLTRGSDTLLVEAALGAGHRDVWAAERRLAALTGQSRKPGFADNAQTFKRVANILRKQGDGVALCGEWKDELLTEPQEKALALALTGLTGRFDALWREDRFDELLALMDTVRPTVDAFFDGVMVMAENPALRVNRLNLLKALLDRMGLLADFSALQL